MKKVICKAKTKQVLFLAGLALIMVCVFIPGTQGYAKMKVKPEMVLPEHYPDGFDGMGIISMITDDMVMIDDDYRFKFAPDVRFHALTQSNVSGTLFKEGMSVGYRLDENKDVISLYLLE